NCGGLQGKFLHPVFPEDSQPCFVRLTDVLGREGLAHAHQGDFARIAPCPPRCYRDSLLRPDNIFRNRHGRVVRVNRGSPNRPSAGTGQSPSPPSPEGLTLSPPEGPEPPGWPPSRT